MKYDPVQILTKGEGTDFDYLSKRMDELQEKVRLHACRILSMEIKMGWVNLPEDFKTIINEGE
jgi:hypothetical protein